MLYHAGSAFLPIITSTCEQMEAFRFRLPSHRITFKNVMFDRTTIGGFNSSGSIEIVGCVVVESWLLKYTGVGGVINFDVTNSTLQGSQFMMNDRPNNGATLSFTTTRSNFMGVHIDVIQSRNFSNVLHIAYCMFEGSLVRKHCQLGFGKCGASEVHVLHTNFTGSELEVLGGECYKE